MFNVSSEKSRRPSFVEMFNTKLGTVLKPPPEELIYPPNMFVLPP